MKAKALALVALSGLGVAGHAAADGVTVISYGGASKEAQVGAFYMPFEKAFGKQVIAGEWNGEMAKVKAMVDTKSVSWDVLDVEDTVHRVSERLDYGIVGINDGAPSTAQAPFGGMKMSGIGREGGAWGIQEYLDTKFVSVGLAPQ